jgi:sugar diacid utilization regulator
VTGAKPQSDDLTVRQELSSLRGLLAMSILMMERRDERDVLHLSATAVPSLVRSRTVGVHVVGSGWEPATTNAMDAGLARVAAQLDRCPPSGGAVEVGGEGWAWAFALRTVEELIGHLVVAGPAKPSPAELLLLLRSLAQQTGIAIANARLHSSKQLANAALAETVEALQRKTAIHDRFTQVALTGGGHDGIVHALHELTGLPAGIEDRAGNLLSWAGPEEARPRRPATTSRREKLADRAFRAGRPIRADGRLFTVARPRADIVGVLLLVDPDERAGEPEIVALEHGATVLAIELTRLLSLAETELRLGVDLVADLVGGTDGDGAYRRAQALGHDLARPYRVIVVGSRQSPPPSGSEPDALLSMVREGMGGERPPLLMQRGDGVVLLAAVKSAADESPWLRLAQTLRSSPAGRHCRIGVGGLCQVPTDYPRSYREGRLALRLAETSGVRQAVACYDQLGVYQLLSEVADPSGIDAFVRQWLGSLLDYDERRGASLVTTLSRYLDVGGNYDATAAELALGRTTVRYRLSRIREISGHDLSDPDTRFQLQLAARAWSTLQALTERRPAPRRA